MDSNQLKGWIAEQIKKDEAQEDVGDFASCFALGSISAYMHVLKYLKEQGL